MNSHFITPIAIAIGAASAVLPGTAGAQSIDLHFATFAGDGLVEQDVFVEKTPGSNEVYRVAPTELDTFKDAMLYASAEEVAFDPMNPEPGGFSTNTSCSTRPSPANVTLLLNDRLCYRFPCLGEIIREIPADR